MATDADIRERNSKLVPELLVTLKELQERERSTDERFKRPFALFSRSPHKVCVVSFIYITITMAVVLKMCLTV